MSAKHLAVQNVTLIPAPSANTSRQSTVLTFTQRENTRALVTAEVVKMAMVQMEWEVQRQMKTATASRLRV